MCINVCKWKLDKSKINIRTETIDRRINIFILPISFQAVSQFSIILFCYQNDNKSSAIFQLQSLVFNWTISRISFQNSLFSKLIGRKGPFCSTFFFMINFALIWRYLREMHLNEKWSKFACQFEGCNFPCSLVFVLMSNCIYWNFIDIGIYSNSLEFIGRLQLSNGRMPVSWRLCSQRRFLAKLYPILE